MPNLMNDLNDNIPDFNPNNDGSSRVQLEVLGISYSQLQSGAYALILAEKHGLMRLPIVVGGAEAQAIAIRIEGITPPRPMTHDLISSLMHAYGLQLLEAFIYKFEDGIFSSELTFIDRSGQEVQLDARTSDAIAIAMRSNAPIFTTRQILDETGFTMEEATSAPEPSDGSSTDSDDASEPSASPEELKQQRIAQLKEALTKAIDNEAYEEASRLTREISDLENS